MLSDLPDCVSAQKQPVTRHPLLEAEVMDAGLQCLFSSLHGSGRSAQEIVPPTFRAGFLMTICNVLHVHAWRFVSKVILDPVKLAITVSHHGIIDGGLKKIPIIGKMSAKLVF